MAKGSLHKIQWTLQNILQLTLEELKSELACRGVATGGRKHELQVKLCKLLAIEVSPEELGQQSDKIMPCAPLSKSCGENSPAFSLVSVHEQTKAKFSFDQLFELEKLRLTREQEADIEIEKIRLHVDHEAAMRKQEMDIERLRLQQNHIVEMVKITSAANSRVSSFDSSRRSVRSAANSPVRPTGNTIGDGAVDTGVIHS